MLRRVFSPSDQGARINPQTTPPEALDFAHAFAAARRQYRVGIICLIAGLVFGVIYLTTAVPRYVASTDILISNQKDKIEGGTATIADQTFDTSAIDSQVEVLKSDKIALAVISALDLTKNPTFMEPRRSIYARALDQFRALVWSVRSMLRDNQSDAGVEDDPQRDALDILDDSVDVRRIEHTYVLTVYYTSTDRDLSAKIANAYAEAYLNEQLDSKFDATKRASDWLQGRLAELKKKSLDSDFAVQKFKADKGLISTGGDRPGLISDQQLTEVSQQMVMARAETAKAEARYSQISELLKSGRVGASVPDSLSNPVISDLRQKYLTAAKSEAQLEGTLGPNHIQVVNLKRSMEEYDRQISDELQRIAESYRSDAEVARAKEQSLARSMNGLVNANAQTNETMVQLRELERESESYRTLYQTFLQRYQETLQQQSFPVSEARVISAAVPPEVASFPKRGTVLMLSAMIGIVFGAGLGAMREFRDRVFRAASQVRDELGLDFLGSLPIVRKGRRHKSEGEQTNDKQVDPGDVILRYSIDNPLSSFAETLRAAKVAVDLTLGERRPKIIGIISVLPNEGKSTVSKNFASLLAHLGARALLIDADLRNPGLTRVMARYARAGIVEAIRGDYPLKDLLLSEPDSGLSFLPAVLTKQVRHSSAVMASAGMQNLFTEAGKSFDYIVVDLPPLGPVVDVRAAASMFDAFVFVVEWGKTPRNMVRSCLGAEVALSEKCVGVIFNKADMKKIHLYEDDSSKELYYAKYTKYYQSERL
jgi:succinoglycan biosynthesis transport protein ExoP